MNAADVARLLLDCSAVELRTDPADWFTWASGKRAPIYCDNRVLMAYPKARAAVADALVESIRTNFSDIEVVAGTATAGIPHAAWVAERMNLPMVYVRGEAKGHGKKKRVEGSELKGERVILIEDLISTGGSSRNALDALKEEGGKVVGIQAIVSYGFEVANQRLKEAGAPHHVLTTYNDLIAVLDVDTATRDVLLSWRKDF